MPTTVWVPRDKNPVQRGDTWRQWFLLHEDFTDREFSLVFAHSRFTPDDDKIEADIDTSRLVEAITINDVDYVGSLWASIPSTATKTIVDNLIEGELQAGPDDTWLKLVVPVVGQINVESA